MAALVSPPHIKPALQGRASTRLVSLRSSHAERNRPIQVRDEQARLVVRGRRAPRLSSISGQRNGRINWRWVEGRLLDETRTLLWKTASDTRGATSGVAQAISDKKPSSKATQTPTVPQQRRLILLRHAKSSWDDPSLRDHERPLSSRGKKASKKIAEKIADEGWLPELILCSDSKRTKQTLELMCEAVPALRDVPVEFLGSYYSIAAMDGQTAFHLQKTVVKYAGPDVATVMCMGHNRGWEEAASEFSQEEVELKTAHGALLQSAKDHGDWLSAFAEGSWKLQQILKPDDTQ